MKDSTWISGPAFLSHYDSGCIEDNQSYILINPDSDVEVRSSHTDLTINDFPVRLGSHRFERFSTWKCLRRTISNLIHIIHSFKLKTGVESACKKWHLCDKTLTEELSHAEVVIVQCVQRESYPVEFACLSVGKDIPKTSGLKTLNPFIDQDGLLRIGGRLKHAPIEQREKHPIIIPGKSHIALLLTRHFHERVRHQGRLFTEGAIRNAGDSGSPGQRSASRVRFINASSVRNLEEDLWNKRWQIFLLIGLPLIHPSLMSALTSLGPGWLPLAAHEGVWQTAKDGCSFLPV